jgi:surface antigen
MNDVFVAGVMLNNHMKQYVAIALATVAVVIAMPVLAIFSMGSGVVSFLSAVPSAEAAASKGFYMGGPVSGDTYEWGNCTYWAYAERLWANNPIPTSWGNANTWDDRAIADSYVVDHTPSIGAVFQTDIGSLGHVAYVSSIDSNNGDWTITEMNYEGLNIVSTRTFNANSAVYYNFIHGKKVSL